jgi:hypothetical protein
MRVLKVVPMAALAALLAGCADEPLTPTEDALSPAFAVGGTDRPTKGEMSGELTFVWDLSNAECPLTTVYDAWGTMSHLGNVYVHGSHCPPAGTLPYYSNGHVVFTAASGDQLVGEYEDPDPTTPTFDVPAPIAIVGGTGRFEGASGTIYVAKLVLEGEWAAPGIPLEPWYITLGYQGAISY